MAGSKSWGVALASLSIILLLLLLRTEPVGGNFNKYKQFGTHAIQMHFWRLFTRNALNTLQTLTDDLQVKTDGLNETLQSGFTRTDIHLHGLNTTTDDLIAALDDLVDSSTNLTSFEYTPPPSAFFAKMSTTGSSPIAFSAYPFKYTTIDLNDGGDYNSVTGLFTARFVGMYWFHATFSATDKKIALMKASKLNGNTETICYLKYYINQETACTATATLYPGETVGVYPNDNSYATWTLSTGDGNVFAGYLVAEYHDPNYTPPSTAATSTTTPGTTPTTVTTQASTTPTTTASTATTTTT